MGNTFDAWQEFRPNLRAADYNTNANLNALASFLCAQIDGVKARGGYHVSELRPEATAVYRTLLAERDELRQIIRGVLGLTASATQLRKLVAQWDNEDFRAASNEHA